MPVVGLAGCLFGCHARAGTGIYRTDFKAGPHRLTVEVLDDDLVHFQLQRSDCLPGWLPGPIRTTPMIHKTDYPGPTRVRDNGHGVIETAEMRVTIHANPLSVTVTDMRGRVVRKLATLRPALSAKGGFDLAITGSATDNAYGLGEQFVDVGVADGDWAGRVRTPGDEFGNALVEFDGRTGGVGNAQFPMLYALGKNGANVGLFVDDLRAQTWDLSGTPWLMKTASYPVGWFVMTGPDLPDLRGDYMELVGHPPVPPRKMFGLWVSEYGYENWAELEDKLRTLREHRFPVDGFVLDLQWFGGIARDKNPGRMGALAWDARSFPDPAKKIARLRDEQGVGLMLIEESYVAEALPEFSRLAGRGSLVRQARHGAAVSFKAWWGTGGMLDWTDPDAGDHWHDWKRQPLVEDGVLGHWTDLGEPEQFNRWAWYHGSPERGQHAHRDVHNLYNFRWAESIARGYARNAVRRRPFIMSRSGTSGVQRFGVAMWSGDIGSRLSHLRTHLNAQMHMSFSGVDYFGADIGGFRRGALDGDLDEMYTQWFANGAAFDVPVRPHTSNHENAHETSPDRIGDLRSNLASIRQRYELIPYLYSLAHRAHRYGEPVMPPLVYYYQDDPNVREMGGEKLLGRDLLVAAVARYGAMRRDVYLPAGRWINYHTHERFESRGEWLRGVPLYADGVFRLPMFARGGAIIPLMFVDAQTMNAMGRRLDGTRRDELIANVYADPMPSEFTLFEDDGRTIAQIEGAVRTTVMKQAMHGPNVTVTIHASRGTYDGAVRERDNIIRLFVHDHDRCRSVILNGTSLTRLDSRVAFESKDSGWYDVGNHLLLAKSGRMGVKKEKSFVFSFEPGSTR